MSADYANNTFQFWEYKVSHQQLLLRSPKVDFSTKNTDVIFVGVRYLEINTLLEGLSFGDTVPGDFAGLDSEWFIEGKPYELFILLSGGEDSEL